MGIGLFDPNHMFHFGQQMDQKANRTQLFNGACRFIGRQHLPELITQPLGTRQGYGAADALNLEHGLLFQRKVELDGKTHGA